MKKVFIFLSVMIMLGKGYGQSAQTISLDECYRLARQQYPLIKQADLIEKTKEYSIENASKGYYPQFSVNGQATYQYPVISIPFNLDIPKLGVDIAFPTYTNYQYKVDGEVDQVVYDGGTIKYTKEGDEANAKVQQENLEAELYALKDRINQIYFGVLLMDDQIRQNELTQHDLQSSIDEMQQQVTNGTALSSALDELQAELLQQQQNKIDLESSRKAYLDMLGVFISLPLDTNTLLQIPLNIIPSDSIKRPELSYYDEQKRSYDIDDEMLSAGNRPKFSFFVQGGYAEPGLNEFNPGAAFYYIGGVRLSWNFGGYYTTAKQRQIINIEKQTTDVQKETFLFNTQITLKQQNTNLEKLHAMIDKDNDIVAKRTAVKDASKAQMENGTITIHDYITELDAEDQAKQSLLLHEVQLLLAEYSYQNTTGNL